MAVALPAALKTLLSDTVTFAFLAQGCHWNVEGADFYQYHGLFGEIYADAFGAIDPIAENMRKCNVYAPFDLQTFIDSRNVTFKNVKPNAKDMAQALLDMNREVTKSVAAAFKAAEAANEQGIADFLSARDDMHKKWSWFLLAATK